MAARVYRGPCGHKQPAAGLWEPQRPSETSVGIQLRTRQYIPEDSELHTRRRENLKSPILFASVTEPPLKAASWTPDEVGLTHILSATVCTFCLLFVFNLQVRL
jgi:hypothetical protein